MSGSRLLVTGAGGFCGEHACRYFVSRDWQVTAAVRRLPDHGAPEWAWLGGVDAVRACELSSRAETLALVERAAPDYVLHLAGANAVGASWSDPAAVLQSNVMGTVHLLEGIRSLGTPCRVLVAGSMLRFPLAAGEAGATGPQHPYSLSKTMQVLVAQSWASLFGMDIIVAEPANLIGPGRSGGLCGLLARYAAKAERAALAATEAAAAAERAAGAAAAAERAAGAAGAAESATAAATEAVKPASPPPFRFSSRGEQRDLLDVRDAITAYETLLRTGVSGRVYPVASGVMRTLAEIAEAMGELALQPLSWEFGASVAASPAHADNSALRALGWTPRYTLRQSLQDALASARESLKDGSRSEEGTA